MSVIKAFFGLGKLPKVVKFFEFQSFDDVNKMGGAIRAIREEARTSGAQLTKSQQKYLDDQQRQVEMVFEQLQQPTTETGIKGTQSAKIIDMQGKEIPKGSKIMGGKASETDAEIKARIEKGNKKAVGNIRKKNLRDDISKLENKRDARALQLEQRGVEDFETDNLYNKINEQINDLELKLEFEDMVDPENLATGGRAGFFMGSPNPKGLGTLRAILNYMAKTGKEKGRFQGVDLSGLDMLRLSNPKSFNKLLEDVRGKVNIKEGIMGTDTVRAQQQALREKRKGLTEKSLDVAKAMKADDDRIAKKIAQEAETTIIPEIKRRLMKDMGMSEEVAEKAARDMAEAAQNIRPLNAPPKITEEGILQLENVLKNMETGGKKARDLNADGGRIGFKDGINRRTFLKLFTGFVSLPIIGKVFAPLKLAKGVKNVPIIKTDDVAGKPEWFDQLVNKVIIEGDDVTKKFATGERQSIHQKTLDDGSVVRVTEDVDDGAIRVEYDSPANTFEDTVQLQYKKPLPDEVNPRPTAEFTTAESGPVGRSVGPDDYDIDVDEVGGTSIRDLDSDVSKLKEYATGQKPTMKELVQNIERRKKAKRITEDPEAQSDAVTARQGDADDSYYGDPEELASGGIARLLGE